MVLVSRLYNCVSKGSKKLQPLFRSSRLQILFKLGVSKNFAIFIEPLFNSVARLKACNFIKKRLQDRFFP